MAGKSKGNSHDAKRVKAAKRMGYDAYSRAMNQNMGMEPKRKKRSK